MRSIFSLGSGAGGLRDRRELVIIVVLVLIIVAAIATSVGVLLGGNSGASRATQGRPFWCRETGKQIVLKPKEILPNEAERFYLGGDTSFLLTNPRTALLRSAGRTGSGRSRSERSHTSYTGMQPSRTCRINSGRRWMLWTPNTRSRYGARSLTRSRSF